VSATQINVGAISTLSGPISAGFASFVPGVEAYFDTVNAKGGVDGRKINLAYNLNDTGTQTRFETETHTVIDQDHAFAVFASSYWFNPTYFTSTCTPTYGYNVTGDWTTAPNLFAAGGSVETDKTIVPAIAYLIKKTKAKSVAVIAYNVSTSSTACQATINGLQGAGYDVSYSDLELTPITPDVTPDVQRMRSAGTGFIVSCMTVDGNIAMARALKEYSLHVKQLWLTVPDQAVLDSDSGLMQGVYFNNANVPLAAAKRFPGTYPGLDAYLVAMKRYEPAYIGDGLAMHGWESAALLVTGIKAAGKKFTQASLVEATNRLTEFTAGGIIAPMNWTETHSKVVAPFCSAFVEVQGHNYEPAFTRGKQVYLCFSETVRNPEPGPVKPGTPGP
jgi:ABC-type branched-subunit amino acid transport system substrate-binding protein